MLKIIKKIILSSLSILAISLLIWTFILLNPNWMYSKSTNVENITIYHNQALEEGTELVLKNALNIIKESDIYDDNLKIQFCLNEGNIYPKLYPFAGGTAYAFLNKTVINASKPNFKTNVTAFQWKSNNNELRKYNLTTLLAHEFMHNVQSNFNPRYYITSTLGTINWKFEGHAEYIARAFKQDDQLKKKIALYLAEEKKDHIGVPVFKLADGTIQNLSYFKYAIVIQYLMEEKKLTFQQICALEMELEDLYKEVIEWSQN